MQENVVVSITFISMQENVVVSITFILMQENVVVSITFISMQENVGITFISAYSLSQCIIYASMFGLLLPIKAHSNN
jgi:Mg/Co/Ni transporter MgtE